MSTDDVDVVLKTDPLYTPPKPDAVYWHLSNTAKAVLSTLRTQKEQIDDVVTLIRQCRDSGGTVYVAGNGGSSSTASHFVNDAVKVGRVSAYSLLDNVALLSAYSNDMSYEDALVSILEGRLRVGDILFLISVSGDSPNIVRLGKFFGKSRVIGLGSQRRGRLAELSTVFIEAQSEIMTVSESVHLAIVHAIVEALVQ